MAHEHHNKPAGRAAAAAEPPEGELLNGIAGGIFTAEREAQAEAAFRKKGRRPFETLQDLSDDAAGEKQAKNDRG